MFGRRGKYSTLEGDSLQNVSKESESSQKVSRKPAILILAVVCVIILVVVIVVPIIVINNTHENNNNNNEGLQCIVSDVERVDCYPENDGKRNEDTCHSRGCCWVAEGTSGPPSCFFTDNYGYSVINVSNTSVGVTAHVQKSGSKLPYRGDIMHLKMEAYYETNERLRIKVCAMLYYITAIILLFVRSLTQIIKDMKYPRLVMMCHQRKQKIQFTHLIFRDPNVVTTSLLLYLADPATLMCEY